MLSFALCVCVLTCVRERETHTVESAILIAACMCERESRTVAITAISQYRAMTSITAEECNNRSKRNIYVFSFFVSLCSSRFTLYACVLNIKKVSNDNIHNVYHADTEAQ